MSLYDEEPRKGGYDAEKKSIERYYAELAARVNEREEKEKLLRQDVMVIDSVIFANKKDKEFWRLFEESATYKILKVRYAEANERQRPKYFEKDQKYQKKTFQKPEKEVATNKKKAERKETKAPPAVSPPKTRKPVATEVKPGTVISAEEAFLDKINEGGNDANI
jgi:hypothetical protein